MLLMTMYIIIIEEKSFPGPPQPHWHLQHSHVAFPLIVFTSWIMSVDKLQKRICRTVGLSIAASLEPLAYCQNVVSLSFFYKYYFGRCLSELAQLVPLPYSRGRSTCYSDILQDFFCHYSRISMSTVSFPPQLDSGILCLLNAFLSPMI